MMLVLLRKTKGELKHCVAIQTWHERNCQRCFAALTVKFADFLHVIAKNRSDDLCGDIGEIPPPVSMKERPYS
jgi:hypothetical protein